jgi:hypothetical protein
VQENIKQRKERETRRNKEKQGETRIMLKIKERTNRF